MNEDIVGAAIVIPIMFVIFYHFLRITFVYKASNKASDVVYNSRHHRKAIEIYENHEGIESLIERPRNWLKFSYKSLYGDLDRQIAALNEPDQGNVIQFRPSRLP